MSENELSQDQIDALLGGGDDEAEAEVTATEPGAAAPGDDGDEVLTSSEKDALGEIGNISMGTAATTLSTLVNNKVEITLPVVSVQTVEELKSQFPDPCVMLTVGYVEGFKGNNVLLLKEEAAAVMASLMMGGDGKPESNVLDDMSLSAVTESMNQMMGTVATSMSTMVDKAINISPPTAKVVKLADEDIKALIGGEGPFVTIRFNMKVGDLLESELIQIQPIPFAKDLVESLVNKHAPEEEAAPPPPAAPQSPPPAAAAPPSPPPPPPVDVQKADFPDFGQSGLSEKGVHNLDLLLDVNLQVTAELGRTKMAIRDILELGQGAVVELERFAGEPIDILVNNRLIARAEVVVIDESFGVRITDIISQEERLQKLNEEAS